MTPLPDCLPFALRYAELGWATFPVGPDGRTPWIKGKRVREGGCHAAVSDPERLRVIFRRPSNIALATGERSGVFVLDVDCHGDTDGQATLDDLQARYGKIPDTWEVGTPSGGRHLYFSMPSVPMRNRVGFAPGLDVRTSGGSACLPPSRRADGSYVWTRSPKVTALAPAPDWLVRLIAPPEPPRAPVKPLRMDTRERAVRYVVAAIDGECKAVASTPPNTGRNPRLFQAAARLGELVGGGLLPEDHATDVLERAAHDCGLVRDDGMHSVRATIASGLRRGIAQPRTLEVGQ